MSLFSPVSKTPKLLLIGYKNALNLKLTTYRGFKCNMTDLMSSEIPFPPKSKPFTLYLVSCLVGIINLLNVVFVVVVIVFERLHGCCSIRGALKWTHRSKDANLLNPKRSV